MNRASGLRRRWALWVLLSAPVTTLAVDRACFQGSGHPPPHQRVAGLFAERRPVVPGTAAVILNGPISPAKHHARYWNNASLMLMTLRAVGFESVHVLQSDGISAAPDRQTRSFLGLVGTGRVVDSPRDLDGDGEEDVVGTGRLDDLRRTLADIGRSLPANGSMLLFITGHGQLRWERGLASVAMTWGGGEFTGEELDRMLREAIPPSCWVAVVATQCHSDLFLRRVSRPRTLLVASGRPLWIWSSEDYSVFPYHLAAAWIGREPSSGARLPGAPAASLREAVQAAARRVHTPEWPRYWTTGPDSAVPAPF